jgi:hypothetical protein
MAEFALFVIAALIIVIPMHLTRPPSTQYGERDFLNGKLLVPKD